MLCNYQNGHLFLDAVQLEDVARACGTPVFVYSRNAIEARWLEYDRAFGARPHRVCYAVKANDNLSLLQALRGVGAAFDIVSAGELERVLSVGAQASALVFSGVGKTAAEITRAIDTGVGCINLESVDELERVAGLATERGRVMDVALRVNPDVDAQTHPYISTGLKENKFGVPIVDASALYRRIQTLPSLRASGIACHIGSQLTTVAPVLDAVREVVAVAESLRAEGIELAHIDVGGGLGISYDDEQPPTPTELVSAIIDCVPPRYTIMMEPGRSIVGSAGVMLTRVEYIKQTAAKNFAIVDAAMNDLLRPSLYQAWHNVLPLLETAPGAAKLRCDIVGPVCESGDWLARDRELGVAAGDLIAILDTGAYGSVMASNYNSRPRSAEVLVEGDTFRTVRTRETIDEMLRNERALLQGQAPK